MNKGPISETGVLVIGAGMSGMAAAADLVRAGRQVLVVEKGRAEWVECGVAAEWCRGVGTKAEREVA